MYVPMKCDLRPNGFIAWSVADNIKAQTKQLLPKQNTMSENANEFEVNM